MIEKDGGNHQRST